MENFYVLKNDNDEFISISENIVYGNYELALYNTNIGIDNLTECLFKTENVAKNWLEMLLNGEIEVSYIDDINLKDFSVCKIKLNLSIEFLN